jgi:enolase
LQGIYSVINRRSRIIRVTARQILDSRGRPTIEADLELGDGSIGRAAVPSGASTGRHEAAELRDNDPDVYEGLGVLKAVAMVCGVIADRVIGLDAFDQLALDTALAQLDESTRFQTVGANAVLATSLAACRAAAISRRMPLHLYIRTLIDDRPMVLPMPMTNILSGGAHAGGSMDVQDFLVMPVGASSYGEALAMVARVRSEATRILSDAGRTTLLADEGGLAPGFRDPREALDLIMNAIERAGLRPGEDVAITLDVAASELFDGTNYHLKAAGLVLSSAEMLDYVAALVEAYPISSVEDPLDQDDWTHWRIATERLSHIQVVGDDLFATSADRISAGVSKGVANAVLIKLNQNGTLSGTLNAMRVAFKAGYATIVSARSGETEDSFIADLAVGTGAGQIKIGSVRSSERLSKYNQLLRIEEHRSLAFAAANRSAAAQKDSPQRLTLN